VSVNRGNNGSSVISDDLGRENVLPHGLVVAPDGYLPKSSHVSGAGNALGPLSDHSQTPCPVIYPLPEIARSFLLAPHAISSPSFRLFRYLSSGSCQRRRKPCPVHLRRPHEFRSITILCLAPSMSRTLVSLSSFAQFSLPSCAQDLSLSILVCEVGSGTC